MKRLSVCANFFFLVFFCSFFFRCESYGSQIGLRNTYGMSGASDVHSARNVFIDTVAKSIPAVATTVGAVNMFRAAYRWIRGKPQGPKNRSFAGNECHCKDPDLCWVKRRSDNEIKNLYEQFFCVQNTSPLYADVTPSQVAWNNLGFDKLSEDAQRLLREKFCSFEDERKQQVIQPSKNKKLLNPQPVHTTVVQPRIEKIRQYGQSIVPRNERQQKRLYAIHEVLKNGFHVSYKRYNLSENTCALLGEYGIDAAVFQQCTGNAIQQQIHQEFVSILNGGIDLLLSDQVRDLDDGWFLGLGHFSLLGTQSSTVGHYSLAHQLADVCQGIYDVARTAVGFFQGTYELSTERLSDTARVFIKRACQQPDDVFEDINSVLTDSTVYLTECGRLAEEFLCGVAHKAFVRPFVQLAELSAYTRSNPEIIRELVNKALCATAKSVYKGCLLSFALDENPSSKKTEQCACDFRECLTPLCAGIEAVVQEFAALSNKEKAEEAAALVVQWMTINGFGRLAHCAAQEGQLAKLAGFVTLAEEGTPLLEGLGSGGAIAVSLPVAEEIATGVTAGFEIAKAAGATGAFAASKIPCPSQNGSGYEIATGKIPKKLVEKSIALRAAEGRCCKACQSLLSQEGGCVDQCCSSCKHSAQAFQKAYDDGTPKYRMLIDKGLPVKKSKIILSTESFCLTEAQCKQLEPLFNHAIKSQGVLMGKDLPEEFILTEKFWRHIFTGELEVLIDSSGKIRTKLSGFHFDSGGKELSNRAFKLVNAVRDGKTGAYKGAIRQGNGKFLNKSFFPEHWSPKRVAQNITEALENINIVVSDNSRLKLLGLTEGGMKIEIISEVNGVIVTAYPKLM